jgi:hypothetical protein
MSKRLCPQCGSPIKGHPNKKFCNGKCKDQYHNRSNPRGAGTRVHPADEDDGTDDYDFAAEHQAYQDKYNS